VLVADGRPRNQRVVYSTLATDGTRRPCRAAGAVRTAGRESRGLVANGQGIAMAYGSARILVVGLPSLGTSWLPGFLSRLRNLCCQWVYLMLICPQGRGFRLAYHSCLSRLAWADRPAPATPVFIVLIVSFILAITGTALSATLAVGPGKAFARVEQANEKVQPGDLILVYPLEDGKPYQQTAVFVRQKEITFRAVPKGSGWVKISGEGFDYSGQGSTPRAIFQFNRGADNCVLEGFDLSGAHNHSHNGAGVRINQANNVTIRKCDIHHNDMGIMSNGDGTPETGRNQRIEFCPVHHNGNYDQPGFNHNFYLGGTSATLSFCEVYSSLTGHNVKSRAHFTRVEYCYVHHSANREFDLVDSNDTDRPDSHAVLIGNVIVKDPACKGNRGVVHFGQDGGKPHPGTLYLVYNSIVTPFISPVVELSAPQAKARLVGNLIADGGVRQANQSIVSVRNGASQKNLTGSYNCFSGGFSGVAATGLDPQTTVVRRVVSIFADPSRHDYRLTGEMAKLATTPLSANDIQIPTTPGILQREIEPPLSWQYRQPSGREKRPEEQRLTLGAYGR
jgi:hypothetical protein